MPNKDEVARILADRHYQIDPDVVKIFRIEASSKTEEELPKEPIKLLEVNNSTIPSGVMPIEFSPHPPSGIVYPSVIVEVTPEEYDEIEQGRLPLPNQWHLGELIPPLPMQVH
jgi:hypothetical protein